jgi:hypothetical protein
MKFELGLLVLDASSEIRVFGCRMNGSAGFGCYYSVLKLGVLDVE